MRSAEGGVEEMSRVDFGVEKCRYRYRAESLSRGRVAEDKQNGSAENIGDRGQIQDSRCVYAMVYN